MCPLFHRGSRNSCTSMRTNAAADATRSRSSFTNFPPVRSARDFFICPSHLTCATSKGRRGSGCTAWSPQIQAAVIWSSIVLLVVST